MKKWLLVSVLFVVAYTSFLVATAPASLLLNIVEIPKNVVVQGVSGSVWHTNAEKVYIDNVTLDKVEAKFDWSSVFAFAPALNVTFGDEVIPGPEGELFISMKAGVLEVTNANALIPANMIARHIQAPVPIIARGNVELTVSQFQQGKPLCETLTGDVNWQRAKLTALNETIDLGPLKGKLACNKGAIALTVSPENKLGLTYSAFISANGRVNGNGYLQPGRDFPPELNNVLPFLGQPDRQGRYRLRM